MTDEEKAIWKKSNEYLLEHFTQTFRECVHDDILTHLEESYANGYKDGLAEGRKENAELKTELFQKSDTNHSLVEQLTDKEIIISELKAQIEKMKNCQNCKHCKIVYDEETKTLYNCIPQKESECKWELAE